MRPAIFLIVVAASAAVITAAIGPNADLLAAFLAFVAALAGLFEAYEDGFFDDLDSDAHPIRGMRIVAGGFFVVALFSFIGLLVERLFK